MCDISRRGFLAGGAAVLSLATESKLSAGPSPAPEVGKIDPLAPDVYFHEGQPVDTAAAYCNNGWILFQDYVLVIDANFPAGAREIIGKIRAMTDKPIRFALDTHHHGDHAYGNEVYVENGAVPVAHANVIEELKKAETGYYDSKPGGWEKAAEHRADVKSSKLKPPTVLYSGQLVFDDGKHRVEVMNLGVAHTHGDSFAWLPKERILFAGDACVNGPHNFTGDGDVGKWIQTLEAARKLGAQTVCPGHGPRSTGTLLDDQQAFFLALQDQVRALMAGISPADASAQIETIRTALQAKPQIARYVPKRGPGGDSFPAQVGKVYEELTGYKLQALSRESQFARHAHARAHGLSQA